ESCERGAYYRCCPVLSKAECRFPIVCRFIQHFAHLSGIVPRIFPEPAPTYHTTVEQCPTHGPVKEHPQPDPDDPHTEHDPQRITRYHAATPHAEHRDPHRKAGIACPF